MTGMFDVSRSRLSSSIPSMRGILISNTPRSAGLPASARNADSPSVYTRVAKPSDWSAIETDANMLRSSSTNTIEAGAAEGDGGETVTIWPYASNCAVGKLRLIFG